VTIPP